MMLHVGHCVRVMSPRCDYRVGYISEIVSQHNTSSLRVSLLATANMPSQVCICPHDQVNVLFLGVVSYDFLYQQQCSSSSSSSLVCSESSDIIDLQSGDICFVTSGRFEGLVGYVIAPSTAQYRDGRVGLRIVSHPDDPLHQKEPQIMRKNMSLLARDSKMAAQLMTNYEMNQSRKRKLSSSSSASVGCIVKLTSGPYKTKKAKIISLQPPDMFLVSLLTNQNIIAPPSAPLLLNRKQFLTAGQKKDQAKKPKHLSPAKELKKPRRSINDEENVDAANDSEEDEDDGGESRNNLYWVDGLNYPCLWYGDEAAAPEVEVAVLPFSNAPSSAAVLQRRVKRKLLLPLDGDLLEEHCSSDVSLKSFCYALLDFAEYDDHSRDSYFWPEFITDLLGSRRARERWLGMANRSVVCYMFKERRWVYLLHLCAQQAGLCDDLDSLSRLRADGVPDAGERARYGVECTYDDVLAKRVKNLLATRGSRELQRMVRSIRAVNRTEDNQTRDFKRSHSRVGVEYQVPALPETAAVVSAEHRPADPPVSLGLVFSPCDYEASDAVLVTYMRGVQVLRARHVSSGQLVEAPAHSSTPSALTGLSNQFSQLLASDKSLLPEVCWDNVQGKRQRLLACTVVSKKPKLASAEHSSKQQQASFSSSSTSSPSVGRVHAEDVWHAQEVEVFDGFNSWTVPITALRLLTVPEDEALSILHDARYCVSRAWTIVEAALVTARVTASLNCWSKKNLQDFVIASQNCDHDIRAVWQLYNSIVARDNATNGPSLGGNGAQSSGPAMASADPSSSNIYNHNHTATNKDPKSCKEIVDMYQRLFQGSHREGHTRGRQHVVPSGLPHAKGGKPRAKLQKPRSGSSGEHSTGGDKQPNRWPPQLPRVEHNMYWIRTNNAPCVCTGLKPDPLSSSAQIKVVVVSCGSYHHEILVNHSALEPLTERNIKQCSDDKSVGLALAMIDFANWEMENWLLKGKECLWYTYPDFIRTFLTHAPTWKDWRAQVERRVRGRNEGRRTTFFDGLVDEFHRKHAAAREPLAHYPWDDSPLELEEEEEEDGTTDADPSSPIVDVETMVSENKGRTKSSSSGDKRSVVLVHPKRARRRSVFNMYWIPKSRLPCLYYDTPEAELEDKFQVLPVCCESYHYQCDVSFSQIEALTPEKLKECTDERTHDFAAALMGFAVWQSKLTVDGRGVHISHEDLLSNARDAAMAVMAALAGRSGSDLSVFVTEDEGQFYHWPDFILDMVSRPREWASWRKSVERGGRGTSGKSRRDLYFEALCGEYGSSKEE